MTIREHLIREMSYQHSRGMLVPFLGSGMSRPICSSWPGMVSKLDGKRAMRTGSPALMSSTVSSCGQAMTNRLRRD